MTTPYTYLVSSLLFPLHERIKRHDTRAILVDIEQSQWLSPDALRARQCTSLAGLMASVGERVPFYRRLLRERRLDPGDFRDIHALSTLPVVDKTVIRTHFNDFVADGARDLVAQRTSGSSGEPLQFYLGRHRISFDIAAKWRATRWWDVDIGDHEMVFWGSAIETGNQGRIRRWRDAVFRSRLVPTHDFSPARMDRILAQMREWQPTMLFGYPSALSRLAFRAREIGMAMDDVGVRVAFCTSEVLRPEWREAIAGVFGCGVANEYGARDAGFVARECPAGGLHVTAEEVIVEIVDEHGRPVPEGEEGEIVVTNLAGPEFPFIRYRTGDRGALSRARCACGRGLPMLERISGRANDGLVPLAGGWVHGSAVNHLMRDLPGLKAYRIEQEARDRVRIMLVLDGPLPDALAAGLVAHFRAVLGQEMTVNVVTVDVIPPLSNGKFRHIICKVAHADEAAATPYAK